MLTHFILLKNSKFALKIFPFKFQNYFVQNIIFILNSNWSHNFPIYLYYFLNIIFPKKFFFKFMKLTQLFFEFFNVYKKKKIWGLRIFSNFFQIRTHSQKWLCVRTDTYTLRFYIHTEIFFYRFIQSLYSYARRCVTPPCHSLSVTTVKL